MPDGLHSSLAVNCKAAVLITVTPVRTAGTRFGATGQFAVLAEAMHRGSVVGVDEQMRGWWLCHASGRTDPGDFA